MLALAPPGASVWSLPQQLLDPRGACGERRHKQGSSGGCLYAGGRKLLFFGIMLPSAKERPDTFSKSPINLPNFSWLLLGPPSNQSWFLVYMSHRITSFGTSTVTCLPPCSPPLHHPQKQAVPYTGGGVRAC